MICRVIGAPRHLWYRASVPIPPLAASDGPPPGRSVTHIAVRVRFGETDLMAIVHHANYLLYFEEARVEYLLRRGAVYAEWIARYGVPEQFHSDRGTQF